MGVKEKLLTVQAQLKAPKNQFNKFGGFRYRSCEDILEAVKPILKEQGATLIIKDNVVDVGGRIYVEATAVFADTTSDESLYSKAYARESDTKKGMDASQLTGTASSYARKYALNGLFLIDDTKDADTDHFQEQVRATTKKQAKAKEQNTDEVPPEYLPTNDGKVSDAQWKLLDAEMKRTGITDEKVIDRYEVDDIFEMSQAQVIAALNAFKRTPDKK